MDLHPALTSHCYGRLWKNIDIFNISLFGVERNPPCSVDKIQRGKVWPSSGGNMCRQCTNKVNILAFLLTDKGYGYHPWTWWELSMEKVETLSSLDLWCFVCLFVFRVGLAGGSEEINEIQMYSFGMRQNLNPLINIETNFSATGCSCLILGIGKGHKSKIWFDCALRWSVGLFWIGRWRHLFVPNVCKKRSVGLPQYFISYKIDEHGQHCYIHKISSFYQKYYHINFFSTCYMKG